VKALKGGWLIVDPTLTIDYENSDNIAGQLEVERGFIIGPRGKGLASWYLRPGVGIGHYRAYDWNTEVGYKIIGL
jgi:hypothetical protein